jgi:hypothetical protein
LLLFAHEQIGDKDERSTVPPDLKAASLQLKPLLSFHFQLSFLSLDLPGLPHFFIVIGTSRVIFLSVFPN